MIKIIDKYCCGNCDFYLPDDLKHPVLVAGRCRKDPPVTVLRWFREPLRVRPIVNYEEICSFHPMLHADTERGIEALREAVRREYLDYRPGKNPDEIAAGFSRVPTLEEAKRLARGADAKPGEPVPLPIGES
mgnify:CR=1 FL=1